MIARVFAAHLREMLELFPVVALVGPRQVGKSTLVLTDEIAAGRRYATMDTIPDRTLAEADPVGFLSGDTPVTIDEVQLVPPILREIKRRVDADRQPGRFLLTGSADLTYAANLSHVLAGRVGIVELPPISRFELAVHHGRELEQPLWVRFVEAGPEVLPLSGSIQSNPVDLKEVAIGGFPLSVTATSDRARAHLMDAFRTTYLERDLRRISDIGNLTGFARLMELTAARTATILNQASLGRDSGIPAQTMGRYLSILEASLLIRRMPAWFANIGKRIVKSPKLLWRDTGIGAFLAGIAPDEMKRHPLRGAFFESAIIQELAGLLPVFLTGSRLYYLRTHDGLEIDCVIQHAGQLIPVEIKGRRTVSSDDARPIERWMDLAAQTTPAPAPWGAVIYAGDTVQQLSRRVWALPPV